MRRDEHGREWKCLTLLKSIERDRVIYYPHFWCLSQREVLDERAVVVVAVVGGQ